MVSAHGNLMKPRSAFTVTLGLLFLVQGIWGLFDPIVFGVFTTNKLHSLIHLVLGVAGIMCGRSGRSHDYLFFVGFLLLAVGVLWFLPGATEFVVRFLNLNRAVASLNLVVGVVALFLARPEPVTEPIEHSYPNR